MFCDACGSTISDAQRFCSACGKQIGVPPGAGGGAYPGAARAPGRVAQHIVILSWLWIAIAALTLLAAIVLLVLAAIPFDRFLPADSVPLAATSLIHTIFVLVGFFVLLMAGVHFLAAWGLLHYAEWARMLTIVFAFLRMLDFPLGTALGIYTIWVLMGPSSEREYLALSSR